MTSSATDAMSERVPNNFNFTDDAEGTQCPFSAHNRKMNPRGDMPRVRGDPATSYGNLQLQDQEQSRWIVRRRIIYGKCDVEPKDDPPPEQLPTDSAGLLFRCYQSSINNQFGFIQRRLANSPNCAQRRIVCRRLLGPVPMAANYVDYSPSPDLRHLLEDALDACSVSFRQRSMEMTLTSRRKRWRRSLR
jgi:hypothetical protein